MTFELHSKINENIMTPPTTFLSLKNTILNFFSFLKGYYTTSV